MNKTLQWLIDNKAELQLHKVKGVFCLKIIVKDPNGGKDHYTMFRFEDRALLQNYLEPAVEVLKKSING